MKRILKLLAIGSLAVGMVACGSKTTYEIAMITDIGSIDDKSFNQGTWEGVKKYADEKKIDAKYYKPTDGTTSSYVSAINLAVEGGAKIIVCPGYLFEEAVYVSQTAHPDVKFVLIDGEPHTADYSTYKTEENTLPILFAEEQSGFLAGYAVVKDGFEKLGFTGGLPVPAVKRFGFGYVAGAFYAAEELGVLEDVSVADTHFEYLMSFDPSDTVKSLASGWFNSGVEVIFSAAGGAGNSVMSAASEQTSKWVVGVDVNQIPQSEYVITSAMKQIGTAAYEALTDFYNDAWDGGETLHYSVTNDGVGIPDDFSRFNTFSKTAYDAMFAKLVSGAVVAPDTYDELKTFCSSLGVDISDANVFPTKEKADMSL